MQGTSSKVLRSWLRTSDDAAIKTTSAALATGAHHEVRDLGLGFVDATVIATAERVDAVEVLTTDRRHFSAVRPLHTSVLRLSP